MRIRTHSDIACFLFSALGVGYLETLSYWVTTSLENSTPYTTWITTWSEYTGTEAELASHVFSDYSEEWVDTEDMKTVALSLVFVALLLPMIRYVSKDFKQDGISARNVS